MRSITRDSEITLREITAANWRAVVDVRVSVNQLRFVADNTRSLAEASFHAVAWPRAIYADETPIGFLMLHDERLRDEPRHPLTYYLWRFMIDARFQGLGFGRRAIELLVEHVRALPEAHHLLTSCVEGEGSPVGFYRKLGFTPTGRDHDELELALPLDDEGRPLPPIPPPTGGDPIGPPAGHGYIDFEGKKEHFWKIETIWEAARDLPVVETPLHEIPWADDGCHGLGDPPKWGAVAEHGRRALRVDAEPPVVLGPKGEVVDGMHRIILAYLEGRHTIRAVRLPELPPPDEVRDRE